MSGGPTPPGRCPVWPTVSIITFKFKYGKIGLYTMIISGRSMSYQTLTFVESGNRLIKSCVSFDLSKNIIMFYGRLLGI